MFSVRENCTLIVKGYAGTGKTTTVKAIVNSLQAIGQKSILLAPTGRAAKVMTSLSGRPAFTIHKIIYQRKTRDGGMAVFGLRKNLYKNTLFIIDEASMIGASEGALQSFGKGEARQLLDDLLNFVFTGQNCRLIFIGDAAQLPPVGSSHSPALDKSYLAERYSLTLASLELTEVKRQALNSGILFNATMLRNQLQDPNLVFPHMTTELFEDVHRIGGHELEEWLEDSIGKHGIEQVVVITRSNKRANLFNQQIRHRLLWNEEELNAGDLLMVVKNNYFWLEEEKSANASFIANGDTMEVVKIARTEERYGYRFADIEGQLKDYPDLPPMEMKIMLDTLMIDGPSLGQEAQKALYHYVAEDYVHLGDRKKIHEAIQKDPFYNALQVKFAYAVTCHKSQGGQWPVVFVDQGYVNEDMVDKEFIRWLYTAVTRAQEQLFLIGFQDTFFDESTGDLSDILNDN
jgi:exodeoxyribonuclease V